MARLRDPESKPASHSWWENPCVPCQLWGGARSGDPRRRLAPSTVGGCSVLIVPLIHPIHGSTSLSTSHYLTSTAIDSVPKCQFVYSSPLTRHHLLPFQCISLLAKSSLVAKMNATKFKCYSCEHDLCNTPLQNMETCHGFQVSNYSIYVSFFHIWLIIYFFLFIYVHFVFKMSVYISNFTPCKLAWFRTMA